MAKRFCDTEIWDKEWFMNLSPKHKCLIRFIFDKCDVAGIWDANWILASTYVGEKCNVKDLDFFKNHVLKLENGKYFIPDFIHFQYGKLSETCNPHIKVISILKKQGLFEGYLKGTYRVEDKDMDKEEDKEVEEDKDMDKGEIEIFEIVTYLNEKTKLNFRPSSKHCKSLIPARLKEGFTVEDFRQVIDHKVSVWGQDSKMKEYLRPVTLFGEKFEGYLQASKIKIEVTVPQSKFSKANSELNASEEKINAAFNGNN